MRTPSFITFTGADDRTDLTRMDEIGRTWPVEWGVLFSPSNRDARYPCAQAVAEMLDVAGRKAAHLCGGFAKTAAALRVDPSIPLSGFGRVQLNGRAIDRDLLPRLAEAHGVEVVLQTRSPEFPEDDRCLFLFDASGGNGVFPDAVPPLRPGRPVGYAGGMGPDTVADYLAMIDGDGEFWIDMEGRVRTCGWFDLDKVSRVCERVFGG